MAAKEESEAMMAIPHEPGAQSSTPEMAVKTRKIAVESSTEPNMSEMSETEYSRLAEAALQRIEQTLDAVDAEVDYELAAGGILEISFADGSKIVINKQPAMQEIWVAAKSGGFHFRWDGSSWRNTRNGEELFAALSACASTQAGEAITL